MTKAVIQDGVVIMVPDDDPKAPAVVAPAAQPVTSVPRLYARLALSAAGLLDKVEAAVAAADQATQIWYADAENWRRQDPHVVALAASIGLTDAQVDALFVQADALSRATGQ